MQDLPFLTADHAGIGGVLRTAPEDFEVEELPAYLPSGAGDHVFVWIEKRGLTTPMALQLLARALGVAERDLGTAGMKDRHAVTRQWISLPPPVTPEAALAVNIDGLRVLRAERHNNKLKTGHLRGNRFVLRVRNVIDPATAVDQAKAIVAALTTAPGAPNWYGEQRFGHDGGNVAVGRALVLGTKQRARGRGDQRTERLMVSALQSELFNQWLVQRIADGNYRTAIPGDLMRKRGGGLFDSIDTAVDAPRVASGEIVPTGPMFGYRVRAPDVTTEAGAKEAQILQEANLSLEDFRRVGDIAEGSRRDAAIELLDVSVHDGGDVAGSVVIGFTLPSGAYATVVMREVMKVAARWNQNDRPPASKSNEPQPVEDAPGES